MTAPSPPTPPRIPPWRRNLQRRLPAPAKGRGRIQRAVRGCFFCHGPEVDARTIYGWARRWGRCHDGRKINQAERWSIRRVVLTMADPVRRMPPYGAWLWRLRDSGEKVT